jgi:hypothetical protein
MGSEWGGVRVTGSSTSSRICPLPLTPSYLLAFGCDLHERLAFSGPVRRGDFERLGCQCNCSRLTAVHGELDLRCTPASTQPLALAPRRQLYTRHTTISA